MKKSSCDPCVGITVHRCVFVDVPRFHGGSNTLVFVWVPGDDNDVFCHCGKSFCPLPALEPLVLMAEHEFDRRPMQCNHSSDLLPDTSDERNDFIPHWAAGWCFCRGMGGRGAWVSLREGSERQSIPL